VLGWLALCLGPAALRGRSPRSGCFAHLPGSQGRLRSQGRQGLHALQQAEQQQKLKEIDAKAGAEILAFETMKFNMAWTKMKEAEENKSPQYEALRKEVEEQGKVVEKLGGSLPAEMLTVEEAAKKAAKVKADLSFEKLLSMSNEDRWVLAQGLGPAFPIALILSYTLYWTLNIPFIAYAYFTTVVNGKATFALVMAGAYAASIPFKPFIYIGGILGVPWTAENVMPLIGQFFNTFRLPDESDFDRL